MNQHVVSIIVPVFNEAKTLARVIQSIRSVVIPNFEKEIILIDAGSTDSSLDIINSFSDYPKIKIIALEVSSGKGRAVREGLRLATGDVFLIQDGDLEYSTQDYPNLLKHFTEGKVDFVIGSRSLSTGSWKLRSSRRPLLSMYAIDVGGMILRRLFCTLYGVKISDPLSMFKIFKKDQIEIQSLKSEGFDIDWEILCRLIKKNLKFIEVPVQYEPRTKSEGKKLVPWKEGVRSVRIIFREYFITQV